MFLIDFFRWPFRSQKTHYEGKASAQMQTETVVNAYDTDSLGLVDSGWIDRKLGQGALKGYVDMQLPEQMYKPKAVYTTLSPEQVEKLGWNCHRETKPIAIRTVAPPQAVNFKQEFVHQPYERETGMSFSQMPTPY